VPGQKYVVSFAIAGNDDGGVLVKKLGVSINNGPATQFTFDTTGTSNSNMGWLYKSYGFTAPTASTLLSFTSQEANSFGAALDDVSISAVPEVSTWAMLIAGFGMAGAVMRRRRGVVAA
jgi:Protein of unknown function (DUF642)